jgi:hypothetical protein
MCAVGEGKKASGHRRSVFMLGDAPTAHEVFVEQIGKMDLVLSPQLPFLLRTSWSSFTGDSSIRNLQSFSYSVPLGDQRSTT